MKKLSDDPSKINPVCPVDLVIDHSVQVIPFITSCILKRVHVFQRSCTCRLIFIELMMH